MDRFGAMHGQMRKSRRFAAKGGRVLLRTVSFGLTSVVGVLLGIIAVPFVLSVSDFAATMAVDPVVTNAPGTRLATPAPARPRAMRVCGSGKRLNCVVDGDTLWLDGEKIRVANIDAPEVRGRCGRESGLAAEATSRLVHLLDRKPISIRAQGIDRYGRTLAVVATPEGDVGDALVRQRLAVRWRGRREPASTWCAS